MYCNICRSAGQSSLWATTGVENMRKDSVLKHCAEGKNAHTESIQILSRQTTATDIFDPVS